MGYAVEVGAVARKDWVDGSKGTAVAMKQLLGQLRAVR
jgi:hypothetical protein